MAQRYGDRVESFSVSNLSHKEPLLGMLESWDGEISEKSRSPKVRPNSRKWERCLRHTHYEGLWPAISSPLPCYPPTPNLQS